MDKIPRLHSYNPVKHGFVKEPHEWLDSSYAYWVKKGFYEKRHAAKRFEDIKKIILKE